MSFWCLVLLLWVKIYKVLSQMTALDFINSEPELSTFGDIIETWPNLVAFFNDSDVDITVFAPDNTAIASLPTDIVDEIIFGDGNATITFVLYHVTSPSRISTSFVDGEQLIMENEQSTTIDVTGSVVSIIDIFGNQGTLADPDNIVSNGIVHIIDAALEPDFNATFSPTISPTISPSISPSISPTITTNSPSISPSISTTIKPTRRPTVKPVKKPTFKDDKCLGRALKCSEIESNVKVWGYPSRGIDFTSVGYSPFIGKYTLTWIGCPSNGCDPDDYYCTDYPDGSIEFGSNAKYSAFRSLMGTYTDSSYFPSYQKFRGCASRKSPNDIHNAPNDHYSAKQICKQLGYQDGYIIEAKYYNYCPEPEFKGHEWKSDFVYSKGFGKRFKCKHPCNSVY